MCLKLLNKKLLGNVFVGDYRKKISKFDVNENVKNIYLMSVESK